MTRPPAVAGQFYPGHRHALEEMVRRFLDKRTEHPVIGVVSPHAGYIYSGEIAGATFATAAIPRRCIVLGPNHHGFGAPLALYPGDAWQTPLGTVTVDRQLAGRLLAACPGLQEDELAHRREHSLEVQIPFLQARQPELTIVPICIGRVALEPLVTFGEGLARTILAEQEPVMLVASSDMTHYESAEQARRKDMRAIERVLAIDPEGLYRTVSSERISMCGVLPTVAMLAAARALGATRGELVRYGHSGETSGQLDEVVGYAGITIQ